MLIASAAVESRQMIPACTTRRRARCLTRYGHAQKKLTWTAACCIFQREGSRVSIPWKRRAFSGGFFNFALGHIDCGDRFISESNIGNYSWGDKRFGFKCSYFSFCADIRNSLFLRRQAIHVTITIKPRRSAFREGPSRHCGAMQEFGSQSEHGGDRASRANQARSMSTRL
jgi:hypothetical protein